MVNKRKQGLTQARAKLTSHRMRSATVGTHVPRRSSRHMNGEAVGFSSPRKRKRAARGIVETILPVTSSGESSSQYARRVSRREFAQDIQRKARIRRIVAIAVCLLVAVAVAAAVGVATFFGSLDAKLGLKDSDAASALVAPKADAKAFYTVVSADLDAPGSANATDGPDAIALVPDAENTLIVTDSLAMGAITDSYTPGEAAVQALQAGCDVLLMPDGLADAYDAVLAAVQNGTLSEDRLDLSVNKILRMKAQFCA